MGMRVSHVSKIRCFWPHEKNFLSYKKNEPFFWQAWPAPNVGKEENHGWTQMNTDYTGKRKTRISRIATNPKGDVF
jgi:hypothetical protein